MLTFRRVYAGYYEGSDGLTTITHKLKNGPTLRLWYVRHPGDRGCQALTFRQAKLDAQRYNKA